MKKKLLLIDGNAFCYRAFYAIRKLSTSKGQPTNAIFGFVTMLNKLIAEHKPHYLAVALDHKGPTFRHKRFTNYKVQRKPMPDELSAQIPIIKKVLGAYHIPIFEQKGYEADDIIATLVRIMTKPDKQSENADLEIFIITGDKDILQVVSDNIKIISPHKENSILNADWVKRRFGVPPEKIVDIMGLAGDSSDNIPGVPGIGESTAIELIKKFGTLEEVLGNADKIANKTKRQNLIEFAEQAKMSRDLASLDFNVPGLAQKNTSDLLKTLEMNEANKKELFAIFKELEFTSLLPNVLPGNKDKITCEIISSTEDLDKFCKSLPIPKSVAVYYWASSVDLRGAKILGLAFSLVAETAFFFSLKDMSINQLKPLLENAEIKKTGHDLKYLKLLLSNYGINLKGISFDTLIAAYLLNPEKAKYNLIDLFLEHLNSKFEDLTLISTDKEMARVCCQNASAILKLSRILQKQLKQKNLLTLFQNTEMPLVEVLAEMEKAGICLDKDLLLHLSADFDRKLKGLTKEIYEMAKESFNINSPKQLSYILFEKLKLPRIKRTKTGSSTDTEVLQKLTHLHPLASTLLQFREISKLKSTYLDGLIKLLHPKTGKLHTTFNQTVTATGRLSCSRPNLQNIPIRTDLGRKIRQIFIADKKTPILLSADYSQIELRIVAHLSEDKKLISAFKEDLDIHNVTASLVFGVIPEKVTAQMRQTAKTVNFGIIYGMTPFGLAKDLGIEQSQAQEFIQAYFHRYPGVKSFISQQIKKAEKQGYVTTLLNRRRYIPQIQSADENMRQFAQRVAINTPVQGSASDLIKAAMIEIYQTLKARRLSAKIILQVHDELVLTLPLEEAEETKQLIKDKMENVIKLKVPIKVSIKIGSNWLDMK